MSNGMDETRKWCATCGHSEGLHSAHDGCLGGACNCKKFVPLAPPKVGNRTMNIPETEQNRIDVSNLRFYARLFRENHWETDVMHWSVFSSTLDAVADRIAKAEQAVADKYRLGFEDCRAQAMHVVDEHDGYLERIGNLEPTLTNPAFKLESK